jgi:hypothetical protein
MAANPQTFLRFAAQHFALLLDIFRREGGMNDAELYGFIRRHRADNDPAPSFILEQLIKLKIIEPTPDATASYEMTRPVAVLFRFLLQEQKLTSTAVIQAYLEEIERFQHELENAIREGKHGRIERALNEVIETMERLRQDSQANREAIINEVMAAKSNRERRTVRERFDKILVLWNNYLEPLKDLIDVRKSMDASLDGLERLLKFGAEKFLLDGAMNREFTRGISRLVRLRRDMVADFRESLHEVEPLYQALKRDSALARGASRALERIGKEGIKGLGLVNELSIPAGWLREGLFTDTNIEAYLHGVKGYQPKNAHVIADSNDSETPHFLDPQEVIQRLRMTLPLEDTLGWLLENYGESSLAELLRLYGRLFTAEGMKPSFGEKENRYSFHEIMIYAHPLSLEESK